MKTGDAVKRIAELERRQAEAERALRVMKARIVRAKAAGQTLRASAK